MGVGRPNDVPPYPGCPHDFAGTLPNGTATPLLGEPISDGILALGLRDASHACAQDAYSSESTSRYSCSTCVLSVLTDLRTAKLRLHSVVTTVQWCIAQHSCTRKFTHSCQCETEFPYRMGNSPGKNRFRTLSVSRTMRENRSLRRQGCKAQELTPENNALTCSTSTAFAQRLGSEARRWISQDEWPIDLATPQGRPAEVVHRMRSCKKQRNPSEKTGTRILTCTYSNKSSSSFKNMVCLPLLLFGQNFSIPVIIWGGEHRVVSSD